MNFVQLDADGIVVGRSHVASSLAEEDGFSIIETELWPDPGMQHAEGDFTVPLEAQKAVALELIRVERNQRIDGGFEYEGARFQSDASSRETIAENSRLASDAILIDEAAAGDMRWHGGETDFAFKAEDNTWVPMDAQTMRGLGKTASIFKTSCMVRADALKAEVEAAADEEALGAVDILAGWPA